MGDGGGVGPEARLDKIEGEDEWHTRMRCVSGFSLEVMWSAMMLQILEGACGKSRRLWLFEYSPDGMTNDRAAYGAASFGEECFPSGYNNNRWLRV